jgi:hypothetical protein
MIGGRPPLVEAESHQEAREVASAAKAASPTLLLHGLRRIVRDTRTSSSEESLRSASYIRSGRILRRPIERGMSPVRSFTVFSTARARAIAALAELKAHLLRATCFRRSSSAC